MSTILDNPEDAPSPSQAYQPSAERAPRPAPPHPPPSSPAYFDCPPPTLTLNVRGVEFTLTSAALGADQPNYFTPALLALAETGSKTLYIDRDPSLFAFIHQHLGGYSVLPLPPVPSFSPETATRNLLRDARFFSLRQLEAALVKRLNDPLEVDDLEAGLIKLAVGRGEHKGWWPVVIEGGEEEEALIRLKNVPLGITPDPHGALLTLPSTPLPSFLPCRPGALPLTCPIPPSLLSSTGIWIEDHACVPAYDLYLALSGTDERSSSTSSSSRSSASFAALKKRLDPTRPSFPWSSASFHTAATTPVSHGQGSTHTFVALSLVLRLKTRCGTRGSPRRPREGENAQFEVVYVSSRLETPERFRYEFDRM
ncbi:hypothetical protein JCM8097_003665 [Rhodosporidiobolus ruineniae]